jgi:hypothetical protein
MSLNPLLNAAFMRSQPMGLNPAAALLGSVRANGIQGFTPAASGTRLQDSMLPSLENLTNILLQQRNWVGNNSTEGRALGLPKSEVPAPATLSHDTGVAPSNTANNMVLPGAYSYTGTNDEDKKRVRSDFQPYLGLF